MGFGDLGKGAVPVDRFSHDIQTANTPGNVFWHLSEAGPMDQALTDLLTVRSKAVNKPSDFELIRSSLRHCETRKLNLGEFENFGCK